MTIAKIKRENKGKSLIDFPNNYTIIDIETTGFDTVYDDILEVSAIKIRDNNIVDEYNSLVSGADYISDFILDLTGINLKEIEKAPSLDIVLNEFYNFIGDDILIGHNVNFDINFLCDNFETVLNKDLKNDFVDTLRISRRLNKELKNHKLSTLIQFYKLDDDINQHRALNDCYYTLEIYNKMKEKILKEYETYEKFINIYNQKNYLRLSSIEANTNAFDEDNYFYEKYVVFTGELNIPRKEAAQIIVNLGGFVSDSINKKTNFLILGTQDYSRIKNEKSRKQCKAEELILKGQDLQILSENVFYEIINNN